MTSVGSVLGVVAALLTAALATSRARACDDWQPDRHGRTFYVDPARGAKGNDGSEQKPWRMLSDVLDPASHLVATRTFVHSPTHSPIPINPQGPVKPGDTIVLMSGDYGGVRIPGYVNDRYISIVAGEGQTPVLSNLFVSGSHWRFRGLKISGARRREAPERFDDSTSNRAGAFRPLRQHHFREQFRFDDRGHDVLVG